MGASDVRRSFVVMLVSSVHTLQIMHTSEPYLENQHSCLMVMTDGNNFLGSSREVTLQKVTYCKYSNKPRIMSSSTSNMS